MADKARIVDLISEAKNLAEALRDDFQSRFDELSDKAQEGATGDKLNEEISRWEEVISGLEAAEEPLS